MNSTKTIPPANAHLISLEKAVEMTTRFRQHQEDILAPAYKKQNIIPNSETFNRHAIEKLLAEENCAAIRIYYGMDESLKIHAILVGVNDSNEDILPQSGIASVEAPPVIVEEGQRCPDICPDKKPPLNP